MPIYKYKCPKCGEQYEDSRAVADKDMPFYCPCRPSTFAPVTLSEPAEIEIRPIAETPCKRISDGRD